MGEHIKNNNSNGPKVHGRMRGFEKPKNTKRTLSRMLGYLFKNSFLLILIIIFLILSSGSMLIGSYFLKPLINKYIIPGNFKGFAVGLAELGVIYLSGVIAAYLENRFMVKVAQRTTNSMRKDLFDKMQDLPLKYFDTHTHGELMSRYTNDIDTVQMVLDQSVLQLISSVIMFCGTIIMMLILSPSLFMITGCVIVFMVFLSRIIGRKSHKYFQKQQSTLGELNGYIEEMIGGMKVVKVFNHEGEAQKEFDEINENFRDTAVKANFLGGIVFPIMGNLNNVCYAATAVFGGLLAIKGSMDIGSLAAFLQYSRQIGQPINQMTIQMNNVLAALAGAERIFDVIDAEPEIDEGNVTLVSAVTNGNGLVSEVPQGTAGNAWAWKVPQKDGGTVLVPLKGDVRFNDVSFSYDNIKTVLNDISLYAKPGQTIAFVGSTGAGKTTITNLINRFYDVNQGTITYDGINVKDIKRDDLRSSLGMVLQDTHLFSGTVMENIRYGRLNATDDECIAAAKSASADSFIRRLPQGYDTFITGDGANLSQGQRQLLAIARAYVASPPVMILDEATSSIDTRTERLIEKGMDALMEGRTVFVIAHRLSTVRNADAIMVIEHGKIIERGSHDELIEQKGRYYELYTGQYALD